MKYVIKFGIAYRMIADEYFLISCGKTTRIYPTIRSNNAGAAYYWNLLEKENAPEQLLDTATSRFSVDGTMRYKHMSDGEFP